MCDRRQLVCLATLALTMVFALEPVHAAHLVAPAAQTSPGRTGRRLLQLVATGNPSPFVPIDPPDDQANVDTSTAAPSATAGDKRTLAANPYQAALEAAAPSGPDNEPFEPADFQAAPEAAVPSEPNSRRRLAEATSALPRRLGPGLKSAVVVVPMDDLLPASALSG